MALRMAITDTPVSYTHLDVYKRQKLSYGELERYSTGIGHILQRENVERNSLVAIVMEKGWEQIVAAISILKACLLYTSPKSAE